MTRKASPAQLAWRKKFAAMAKAGAFQRNPLTRVKMNSPSMATGEAPSKRLRKRRAKTAKAPRGVYANPLTRVKMNSPSMATGEAPSKRLRKRRAKTAKAPAGYYANPRRAGVCVSAIKGRGSRFVKIAEFPRGKVGEGMARVYARALHNAHPGWTIKVEK